MSELKYYNQNETFQLKEGYYKYAPELTEKLDASTSDSFTQEKINEIVLWKVNRYVEVDEHLLQLLNSINPIDKILDKDLTKAILTKMLSDNVKGVRLAMASTILRFRNPDIYQIIDQRAYRFAMDGKEMPVFNTNSEKSVSKQIDLYLEYLNRLQDIAKKSGWSFRELDRILYALDKEYNKDFSLKNYGSKQS